MTPSCSYPTAPYVEWTLWHAITATINSPSIVQVAAMIDYGRLFDRQDASRIIKYYLTGFNRIKQDCHPLPLRVVVDDTMTRKPIAYLVSWFTLTIYFAY